MSFSNDPFSIGGNSVGAISVDANSNLTYTSGGASQGPWTIDWHGSGVLGSSTLNPNLVINNVSYDRISGNLNAKGQGSGQLHKANTSGDPDPAASDDWSASGTSDGGGY